MGEPTSPCFMLTHARDDILRLQDRGSTSSWDKSVTKPSQSAVSLSDQTCLCSRTSFWRIGIKTGAISSRQQGSGGQPGRHSCLFSQTPWQRPVVHPTQSSVAGGTEISSLNPWSCGEPLTSLRLHRKEGSS